MDENPIETVLNEFDEEMKRRGVPGDGKAMYYSELDVVVVALKGAMEVLEKEGVPIIADYAVQETLRRGTLIYSHWKEPTSSDLTASFAHPVLAGVEVEKSFSVVITHNRVHGKTQLLIGLDEEAKPFADVINAYLTKWAMDGQNHMKGNPV